MRMTRLDLNASEMKMSGSETNLAYDTKIEEKKDINRVEEYIDGLYTGQ